MEENSVEQMEVENETVDLQIQIDELCRCDRALTKNELGEDICACGQKIFPKKKKKTEAKKIAKKKAKVKAKTVKPSKKKK